MRQGNLKGAGLQTKAPRHLYRTGSSYIKRSFSTDSGYRSMSLGLAPNDLSVTSLICAPFKLPTYKMGKKPHIRHMKVTSHEYHWSYQGEARTEQINFKRRAEAGLSPSAGEAVPSTSSGEALPSLPQFWNCIRSFIPFFYLLQPPAPHSWDGTCKTNELYRDYSSNQEHPLRASLWHCAGQPCQKGLQEERYSPEAHH